MFDRFSHVMLYANDLERAVKWYCEKLGFVPNFVAPNAYASLRHEGLGLRLDLHPTTQKMNEGWTMPYFSVCDIEAAVAALKAKGIEVEKIAQEGGSPRFVTFWDSEGNALGLEETKAH